MASYIIASKNIFAAALVVLAQFPLCTFCLAHTITGAGNNEGGLVSAQTQGRLNDIEKRRQELHKAAAQARKNELIALSKLHILQTKLDVTKGALQSSQHKLNKTENKIEETQKGLETTQTTQAALTSQASRRLREIYEGQRLSLLEMFFQVSSLQSLLDLFYYQERVALMDRKLLEQLKAQAELLSSRKDKLGVQKNRLGDMISEFARKALMINQQKSAQEQIAERLKTQRAFYEQAERQLAAESQRLEQQIVDMESAAKKHETQPMITGSGSMSIPLQAQVTSPFGWRKHPIFGVRRFHTGIDLAGANHSPIKAADSGNVLYSGWYGGYGKVVIISHGKGMATLYAHMSKIAAVAGQNIKKGDIVGYEGTTGFSTGPHLHFEVRVNGKPNNPLNYLR